MIIIRYSLPEGAEGVFEVYNKNGSVVSDRYYLHEGEENQIEIPKKG